MSAAVEALTRLPGVWRGGELDRAAPPGIPTGHAALDRELPGGGWPQGAITEILHDGVGMGEVTLLCGAMKRIAQEGRAIAWVNPPHLPYAPALSLSGIALESCIVIRPLTTEDALWAAEQALRSGACGAVLFWLQGNTDYAWLRRLQMAAQAGRVLAILYRSIAAATLTTPAHLRLVLSHADGRLSVRIAKRRGPPLATPIAIARFHALDRTRIARASLADRRARGQPALALCHR